MAAHWASDLPLFACAFFAVRPSLLKILRSIRTLRLGHGWRDNDNCACHCQNKGAYLPSDYHFVITKIWLSGSFLCRTAISCTVWLIFLCLIPLVWLLINALISMHLKHIVSCLYLPIRERMTSGCLRLPYWSSYRRLASLTWTLIVCQRFNGTSSMSATVPLTDCKST